MLAGWRRQQQARRLSGQLIDGRERFAAFTGCWPWQWTAAQAESWLASGGWAHSTGRAYPAPHKSKTRHLRDRAQTYLVTSRTVLPNRSSPLQYCVWFHGTQVSAVIANGDLAR